MSDILIVESKDNARVIHDIESNDPSIPIVKFLSISMRELTMLVSALRRNTHVVELHFSLPQVPYPLSSMREITLLKLSKEIDEITESNRAGESHQSRNRRI
jgi:hypothetical protein